MKHIASILLISSLIISMVISIVSCGDSSEDNKKIATITQEETQAIISEEITDIINKNEITDNTDKEIEESSEKEEIPDFVNKILKTVTKHGIDGTVIQTDEYNTDGIKVRSIYNDYEEIFDDDGEVIDYIDYSDDSIAPTEYTYNENGDVLTEYHPDFSYTEYFYNDEGVLVREEMWRSMENTVTGEITHWYLSNITKYEYAPDNSSYGEYSWSCPYFVAGSWDPFVITFDIADDEWYVVTYSEYTYDENGNLETEHVYNGENTNNMYLVNYYMYSYYDNGKLKEEKVYDGNLSLSQYTDYGYTDNGYTETIYNGDDTLKREIIYNENGDILHDVSYNSDGTISKEITNTYWSNGKLKTDSDNNEYDYCGNIIFEASSGDTYKYEYDEAGNKTYEKIVSNGSTTEYTYINEYYD